MSDRVVTDIGPYVIVPLWVVNAKISDRALRLYALLQSYADWNTRETFVGRQRLADRLGVSIDSVDRAVKELEKIDAVVVTRRLDAAGDPASSLYRVRIAEPGGSRTGAATPPQGCGYGSRTAAATVAAPVRPYLDPIDLDPQEQQEQSASAREGAGPAAESLSEPRQAVVVNPHSKPTNLVNGAERRRHGSHAWCSWPTRDGLCVPKFLHDELVGKHGGTPTSSQALRDWYPTVVARFEGVAVGDDTLDFWRHEFARAFGTVTSKPTARETGAQATLRAAREAIARNHVDDVAADAPFCEGRCEGSRYKHGDLCPPGTRPRFEVLGKAVGA